MQNKKFTVKCLLSLSFLAAVFLVGSCGSMINDSTVMININSIPEKANFTIRDEYNRVIYMGATPAMIPLKTAEGYFHSSDYSIEFNKIGYKPVYAKAETTVSMWYLFGNLGLLPLYGAGLVGWFIVDPANGKMWVFKDNMVVVTLEPDTSAFTDSPRS